MKSKWRKAITLGAAAIVLLIIGTCAMAGNSSFMGEWGRILKNNSSTESQQTYAKGRNAIVLSSDIEQAKQFFMLSGQDEETAEKNAEEYALEREALYQEAIKNGYDVTDQEVKEYLEELKSFVNSADNKEDFEEVLNQFDSEEDYWDFQFKVYQKNLPIQNYVSELEEKYMESQTYSESDNAEESWLDYFEQFKDELILNEDYQIFKK